MGSGQTAYRITMGQSAGQIKHALAMIPVQEQQAAADLKIRQMAFEQELKQAEAMNLLGMKFDRQGTQPVFVTESAGADQGPEPNYFLMAVLGIAALWYFKKGKLL